MERLSAPSGYKGPQPAVKPDLVGKLSKCGHMYHLHCLVAMYNNGNKVCSWGGLFNSQRGDGRINLQSFKWLLMPMKTAAAWEQTNAFGTPQG